MAHTPGPWREGPTEGIGQRGKLIVVDANGLKVADCEADRLDGGLKFRRPLAEDTANAHLITAAPELLAAVKEAEEFLDSHGTPEPTELLTMLRAAIAKAEGT